MNDPIIFDIAYTPYKLARNATTEERSTHKENRAFYDMSGDKNVFEYINTEGKRTGKFTALEYLEKTIGVFDGNGYIPKERVEEMKERAKNNKGNIWHGFISLSKADSHLIDTPEKCMGLVKETFGIFLKEAHLNPDNIDLMCALHTDKPDHLHMHFVFWEKEPTYKGKDGVLNYRSKGKIEPAAIDRMKVRLALFWDNRHDKLYRTRDEAVLELKRLTTARTAMDFECVKEKVIALAKVLPKEGRLSYGSKDMEPYRERVDEIVKLLLQRDGKAARANRKFYLALHERQKKIDRILKLNKEIDKSKIQQISDIEQDYKRRLGNLVLNLAKFIKPEYYERPKGRNKANRVWLKRSVNISKRKIDGLFRAFVNSFAKEVDDASKEYSGKLPDLEEDFEEKKKKEENYKY